MRKTGIIREIYNNGNGTALLIEQENGKRVLKLATEVSLAEFEEEDSARASNLLEFKAPAKQHNCVKGDACNGRCIKKGLTCRPKASLAGDAAIAANYLDAKVSHSKSKSKRKTSSRNTKMSSPPLVTPKIPLGTHNDVPRISENRAANLAAVVKLTGMDEVSAKESVEAIEGFSGLSSARIRQYESDTLEDDNPARVIANLERKSQAINRYVEAAPKYDGAITRGLKFNSTEERNRFLKSLDSGFSVEALSSFSSSTKVAQGFADSGAGVVLAVKNKSGVSVRPFSNLPDEDEVVVPKGTKYKLTGKSKIVKGVIYIGLEEQ